MASVKVGWEFAECGRHAITTDRTHRCDKRFSKHYKM
jgi:hypothetical protein